MKALINTQQLGSVIRKIRKEQRLTQEQLAAACGVGTRFIRELEQGKESCYIGKALLVVKMLGIALEIDGDDTL
jgi:y4mF family transcriptional regulator